MGNKLFCIWCSTMFCLTLVLTRSWSLSDLENGNYVILDIKILYMVHSRGVISKVFSGVKFKYIWKYISWHSHLIWQVPTAASRTSQGHTTWAIRWWDICHLGVGVYQYVVSADCSSPIWIQLCYKLYVMGISHLLQDYMQQNFVR